MSTRKRTHEIKIRLNDQEFNRLNRMVEKSIYNRETFLRKMLEGYSIREMPKEFLVFREDLTRIASDLRLFRWNQSLSIEERYNLDKLADQTWELVRQMNRAFMPCFREG